MDIMTSLFDQAEVLRRHIISANREREQKARTEGRAEGRAEGSKSATLNFACKMLQLGRDSIEYIANFTGLTIDEVEQIAEELKKQW